MKIEQHQRLEQRQTLRLNQIQIQKLEILQLPVLELRDIISQQLESNPALELREEEPEEPTEYEVRKDSRESEKLERMDDIEHEWENLERKPYADVGGEDKKYEMLQNMPGAGLDLRDYLMNQVMLMEISNETRTLVEQLINNVDDNGYLISSTEEVAFVLPSEFDAYSQQEKTDKLNNALKILQSLDPKGVGARDMKECLLIQLQEDTEHYEIKKLLIEEHLDDLLTNKLPKVAKQMLLNDSFRAAFNLYPRDLNGAIEALKSIREELSHLKPKPGIEFSNRKSPQIVPEIVIKDIEGRLEIIVNDTFVPQICVNQNYLNMLYSKATEAKDKAFIRKKIELAKGLISALDHRRSTLRNIALKIVEYQRDFFAQGIDHLKPLTMQQVANEIGVHISTVSRAASSKYIQTPDGIFPLGFFFASAAVRHHSGTSSYTTSQSRSRLSILDRINEIISEEDKTKPLSDSEIAKILEKDGIKAARRTVAKYRESLGLPPVDRRKKY